MSVRRLIDRVHLSGELGRFNVFLASALSAVLGYRLAPVHQPLPGLLLGLGVFLLACGCSALNQIQERDVDTLMDRTRGRPLPSGRMPPRAALIEALVLIILALGLIGAVSGLRALAAGVLGLAWYNGVYTGLKRKTAFAILPGALVGAVPPALGWLAGGGTLGDPQIRALAFLFFMWQIPHFGLVLLQYGGEYEKAGLPSLQRVFRERQLRRITFHWIMALGVGSLGLGLFGMAPRPWTKGLLLAACTGVIWSGRGLLSERPVAISRVFRVVNWYMVAVSLAIAFPGGGSINGLMIK